MSTFNRRSIFGLFGGGVAASIVDGGSNVPDYPPLPQAVGYNALAGTAATHETYHARHLANILSGLEIPNQSVQKFCEERQWLGTDEASINSMRSISPAARARMLLEIHLDRAARVAMKRRREMVSEYAKPLVAVGILTPAEVDAMIETGEGIEKVKLLAGYK